MTSPLPTRVAGALALALAAWSPGARAQQVAATPGTPAPARTPASRASLCCLLSLRGDVGLSALLGGGGEAAFTAGVAGGLRVLLTDGEPYLAVLPELGARTTSGLVRGDATVATMGVGFSFLSPSVGFTYRPQFAIGDRAGAPVYGMRNGLTLDLFFGALYLEAAHQYLGGDGLDSHELQFSAGVDPGLVAHVLVMLFSSAGRRPMPAPPPPPPPSAVAR